MDILDRVHVMKKFDEKADQFRAKESRELKREGRSELLKHTKFTLLKLYEKRTARQALALRELRRYNLRSVKGCLMLDDFQRLLEYERPSWAGKFLDQWFALAMRSIIKPV